MTVVEISAFLASLVSVAIGIMAIWLSITFYKLSNQLSRSSDEAAKGISASVEKIEKLFDRFYSDTFSIMRDTVSDMRRHIWPEETRDFDKIAEDAEKRADKKMISLKKEMDKALNELLVKVGKTDSKVETIMEEARGLVDQAIVESRKVDEKAREETIRELIVRQFEHLPYKQLEIGRLIDGIQSMTNRLFSTRMVYRELVKMKDEGVLDWDGNLGPSTLIKLTLKRRTL